VPDLETVRRLAPPVQDAPPDVVARARARLRPRRRRRPALLLAPVAAAAALAIVLTQSGGPSFAAELVRAAEASPRLLLSDWSVTRVDEWSAGEGEMTFASGSRTLELRWWPARDDASRGLGKDSDLHRTATVAGARADVYRYRGSSDYTATWHRGDTTMLARALAPSPDAFAALLSQLHAVSAETWLRALPASAVAPADHGGAVDALLKGLPLPPGFDAAALRADARTRDRYQLGAQVAGAVACGWIAAWAKGDKGAVEALATARQWPILREMNAAGDYPEVVWLYAEAVASGGTVVGGKEVSVEESYRDALGC
jgi:hypothetical protein